MPSHTCVTVCSPFATTTTASSISAATIGATTCVQNGVNALPSLPAGTSSRPSVTTIPKPMVASSVPSPSRRTPLRESRQPRRATTPTAIISRPKPICDAM